MSIEKLKKINIEKLINFKKQVKLIENNFFDISFIDMKSFDDLKKISKGYRKIYLEKEKIKELKKTYKIDLLLENVIKKYNYENVRKESQNQKEKLEENKLKYLIEKELIEDLKAEYNRHRKSEVLVFKGFIRKKSYEIENKKKAIENSESINFFIENIKAEEYIKLKTYYKENIFEYSDEELKNEYLAEMEYDLESTKLTLIETIDFVESHLPLIKEKCEINSFFDFNQVDFEIRENFAKLSFDEWYDLYLKEDEIVSEKILVPQETEPPSLTVFNDVSFEKEVEKNLKMLAKKVKSLETLESLQDDLDRSLFESGMMKLDSEIEKLTERLNIQIQSINKESIIFNSLLFKNVKKHLNIKDSERIENIIKMDIVFDVLIDTKNSNKLIKKKYVITKNELLFDSIKIEHPDLDNIYAREISKLFINKKRNDTILYNGNKYKITRFYN